MNWTLHLRTLILAGIVVMACFAAATPQDVTVQRAPDHRALTVRYTGAAIALVEIRLNGASYSTRAVSDRSSSGEASFTIEPSRLRDGDNQVEVRLYDGAGKLVATERTTLTMDRTASGPVFLAKPGPGSTLQGMVEISVGFKSSMKNPYVSFFVNDQFKSLRNFAPYTFLWDTTQVDNGWHEVEAWVIDQSSQTFKTERLRVFVNNPGGRTNRVAAPPEAEAPVRVEPAAAPAAKTRPVSPRVETVAGSTSATVSVSGKRLASPAAETHAMGLRTMKPTGKRTAAQPVGSRKAQPGALAPAPIQVPPSPVTEVKVAAPPTDPRVTPPAKAPGARSVPPKPKVSPAATPSETSLVVSLPSTEASVVAPRAKPSTKPVAKPVAKPVTKAVAKPVVKPAVKPVVTAKGHPKAPSTRLTLTYGSRLAFSGAYSISLDGRRVEFDVAPRVEEGIALAPFRHLIEHGGGQVRWLHEDKTVRAEGLGRDVWFRIGEAYGHDGGESVALERPSFLDRGRAIVPLSFVQSVLGVDVQIDPKTRHALVTKSAKD